MKLFVVIICLIISKLVDPALRIRWGENANIEEHPYIAALLYRFNKISIVGIFSCTCTIIKPMWTLTAAHCLGNDEKNKRYHLIGYGTEFPTKNLSTSDVLETRMHPSYIKSLKSDIALLKTEPIALSQYGKVSAVHYTTLIGHAVHVFGYGLMQDGEFFSHVLHLGKPLQVADMVIKKCERTRIYNYFPSVCLSPRCGKVNVVCPGDSGGPVMHSSRVVAVVRSGIGRYCHVGFIPDEGEKMSRSGEVTPVSPYIDWISGIIK